MQLNYKRILQKRVREREETKKGNIFLLKS